MLPHGRGLDEDFSSPTGSSHASQSPWDDVAFSSRKARTRNGRPVGPPAQSEKGGAQNLLLISNSSTGRSAARGIVPLGPDLQLSASIRPTCDGALPRSYRGCFPRWFLAYDPQQHLLPAGPGVFGRAARNTKWICTRGTIRPSDLLEGTLVPTGAQIKRIRRGRNGLCAPFRAAR
jgi:hypothetical protein